MSSHVKINRTLKKLSFLIFSLSLYYYLKVSLSKITLADVIVDNNNNIFYLLSIIFMTLVSFINIFEFKIIKGNLSIALFLFFGYISLVSYFNSFSNPLSSNSLYILIILPLLVYFYAVNLKTSDNKLILIVLIIFIALSFEYFNTYEKKQLLVSYEFASNSSYFILFLFPLLLLSKNHYIIIFAIVITFLILLSSLKRSGNISLILSLFAFYIANISINNNTGFKKSYKHVLFPLITVSILILALLLIDASYNPLIDRFIIIKEDGGSGRLDVWTHTFQMIKNSNVVQLFIGHGWDSVLTNSKLNLSAHNDFLEITYDFGLVGLLLYTRLHIAIIKYLRLLYKVKDSTLPPTIASYTIFLISSLFSHVIIYPYYMIIFGLTWGIFYGRSKIASYGRISRIPSEHKCDVKIQQIQTKN